MGGPRTPLRRYCFHPQQGRSGELLETSHEKRNQLCTRPKSLFRLRLLQLSGQQLVELRHLHLYRESELVEVDDWRAREEHFAYLGLIVPFAFTTRCHGTLSL